METKRRGRKGKEINICKQMKCDDQLCLIANKTHCLGMYWKETCMFYDVHLDKNMVSLK